MPLSHGRIRERNRGRRTFTARMPFVDRVGRKDGEGSPNQAEGDEVIVGERFVIQKYSEEKAPAG